MSSKKDTKFVTPDMLEEAEKRLHSMLLTVTERLFAFESRVETQVHDLETRLASQCAKECKSALETMRSDLEMESESMRREMRALVQETVNPGPPSPPSLDLQPTPRSGYQILRAASDSTPARTSVHEQVGVACEDDMMRVTLIDQELDVEAKSQEYRSIVEAACEEHPLKADVWGATTFLIVKDFADAARGNVKLSKKLKIFMSLTVYVMNLAIQMSFLYWMMGLVMLPQIHRVQDTYKIFRSMAFDSEGNFDMHGFESLGDHRARLCEMALSTPLFSSSCVFLWVIRCCDEFRAILRRKSALDILPQLPEGVASIHMVHEISVQMGDYLQEEKNLIVCLNTSTRVWLGLLIFIPRAVVATCLLLIGTAFLFASTEPDDLILNSLAMAFIFDIDALYFQVFLPEPFKEKLAQTFIKAPIDDENPETDGLTDIKGHKLDLAIVKGFLVLISASAFLVMWFWFQPILPGYEYDIPQHCVGDLNAAARLPCSPWDGNCFPK